jgi:ethanolamine permease
MGSDEHATTPNLDGIVQEVAAEAHVHLDLLRPEEQAYLKEHSLKKPLRVLDIWALGVGVVITGAYFGWNLGLKDNGPVAMLIASLIVCLLYMGWVLALAELSVALPFAGGPLAYGRRAANPLLGFVMGWSMFLECQFATIGTAIATGGYVAFLLNNEHPSDTVQLLAGLGTVALFFFLQAWGVKEQSWIMMAMTYGAIAGLVLFWIVAATHFSWQRVWPRPDLFLGKGWKAVLDAVPYALWWLVMIETVALAAEEAHEPGRTLPRGLIWSQLTLIALVVLTWFFACGALDSQEIAVKGGEDISYPLAEVVRRIPAGESPLLVSSFGTIALFGLIASYHGMVYGTSRQAFSLGRAGYLPGFLGEVHAVRRTPVPALLTISLIAAGCVVANFWYKEAIALAVLVSTLTALIWYVLAMVCLLVLRRREPGIFTSYRAPLYRVLPIAVVLLSIFGVYVYSGIDAKVTVDILGGVDIKVVPLTAVLYALGLGYYWFRGRHQLHLAAPEELAARQARGQLAEKGVRPPGQPGDHAPSTGTSPLC